MFWSNGNMWFTCDLEVQNKGTEPYKANKVLRRSP